MLRIAKSSPGILDLSAVKDEFGLPVTLNGASHRDVPDHEQDNPVLQRILSMQWVTVTKLPLGEQTSEMSEAAAPVPASDDKPLTDEPLGDVAPSPAVEPLGDVAPFPETEQLAPSEQTQAPDGSNKAIGKPDTRKAGRRS
jgi:hypothetical protein